MTQGKQPVEGDRLSRALKWFRAHAWRAKDVANQDRVVARLLQIADERGVRFETVVEDLSDWALCTPAKANPKRNIARFYINNFKRANPPEAKTAPGKGTDARSASTLVIDGRPQPINDVIGVVLGRIDNKRPSHET